MKKFKQLMHHIFIDGLSGMALGLFATLIIGTIIQQIGNLVVGDIGKIIFNIGKVAASLTGAGIGVGVAHKFKASPLVIFSAATAGMVGGFANAILSGGILVDGAIVLTGPGEPLGAFIAAAIGITIGSLISGKTKLDILLTPLVTISAGSVAGLLIGAPIATFLSSIGSVINWATTQQPLIMGIIVSVIMGVVLTAPISSAALGIILNLSGLAAGAATIGCCCNMVGFAVASYRENKMGGLLAQGLGTSMLQVPNIVRNPRIWIPPIISSALLAPLATLVLKMENNATGSGMGTSGLVGQIMTYQVMSETASSTVVLAKIACMHFILPAIVTLIISEFMRKKKWIKKGDMALNLTK